MPQHFRFDAAELQLAARVKEFGDSDLFRQFDFLSPWEGAPLPGDEKAKQP